MYLNELRLVNCGPIEEFHLKAKLADDGSPHPIILTGRNGSGKSIVLAHIVNILAVAQSVFFEDSDVHSGKVFKLRSPIYIRTGSNYSSSVTVLSDGSEINEIQLNVAKSDWKGDPPDYKFWDQIPVSEISHFQSNINKNNAQLFTDLQRTASLFFPPNRHEEPAWLNDSGLRTKAEYFRKKNFSTTSDRSIIHYSPLKGIQDWLLDLIYNSFAVEGKVIVLVGNPAQPPAQYERRDGEATRILNIVERILLEVVGLPDCKLRWSIGLRNQRAIGFQIIQDNQIIRSIDNLFMLSTGELSLIDIFLSIVRDIDFSEAPAESMESLAGIVVIDELDAHLHSNLQFKVLPRLLSMMPRIQFVITAHSPLLLLGVRAKIGLDKAQIVELPTGAEVDVESLAEFEDAFKLWQDTAAFKSEVEFRVQAGLKPILYVEGTTDRDYLIKAAELLKEAELLEKFEVVPVNGSPYLDKLWDAYRYDLNTRLKQPWILLYDCDTKKSDERVGQLFKRVIPRTSSLVNKGIENLFSDASVSKAMEYKPAFIDVQGQHQIRLRGDVSIVPEKWFVNNSEKRNLCDWMRANGSADDFLPFLIVFEILKTVLAETE